MRLTFDRYFDVLEAISSILMDPIVESIHRDDIHLNYCRGNFQDLHNSLWWKETESKCRSTWPENERCSILPIILSMDDTTLDVTGKYVAKPMSFTIGTLSNKHRVTFTQH